LRGSFLLALFFFKRKEQEKPNEVNQTINFASESSEIHQYLSGEAIHAEGEKGWNLVTVDGYSIGWGKLSGGILKNHYPKGLRFSGK